MALTAKQQACLQCHQELWTDKDCKYGYCTDCLQKSFGFSGVGTSKQQAFVDAHKGTIAEAMSELRDTIDRQLVQRAINPAEQGDFTRWEEMLESGQFWKIRKWMWA